MRIVVSMGDANGIGLEVFLKAAKRIFESRADIHLTLAGNPQTISEYISKIQNQLDFDVYFNGEISIDKQVISICDSAIYSPVKFGEISPISGKLAGRAIEAAISGTMMGSYEAMVTLPISKEALNMGGYNFTGHTEFLEYMCEANKPLMILCTEGLNVALVTIHESLRNVPEMITVDLVHQRIAQFFATLKKDFANKEPNIAVLSLNPHAGENGKMGDEENNIIIPAMQSSEYKEYLSGPFPADGFFAHGEYKNYDGVLAMYHDQGLIPLKLIANGAGVNFTAGLPIVRTSPDHGTGFAISGQGIADEESTYQAILLAEKIAKSR